jgi:uncharacterized protein YdaU (DUF1376 family)
MYSYPHHIGDFIRDTSRLSDSQAMTYLRLIWMYYDTEKPLPNDPEKLAFMLGASPQDTRLILGHFFYLDGEEYRHKRCDAEIEAYRSRQDHGRKAAKARWENAQSIPGASIEHTRRTKNDANREPITDNREPVVIKEPKGSLSEPKVPPCQHQAVIDLFHEVLPELPRVMIWNKTREGLLKARWRERAVMDKWQSEDDGLKFFRDYFDYVRRSKFLMGKVSGNGKRPFECELEWLIRPNNWVKVLEGKYHAA